MQDQLFREEYSKLNTAQKQAVDSIYGQIMVVAGPGTGKTQIIGLRTANIILKSETNPENILITTFTEAWVVAIRERLLKFIGNEAYKVGVSTIHSFAQDVIKTFPEKFIEYKAGTAVDDVDQLEIIKHIIDNLIESKQIIELTNDYDPYLYLRDIKTRISNLKWEWISITQFEKGIEHQIDIYSEELSEIKPTLKKYEITKAKQEKHIAKLKELAIVFTAYNSYLRKSSLYDFNDMINFVVEKFRTDSELTNHYAEQYQFIMLDEYQDTNNAQNEIIKSILSVSEEDPNIMVVWDDDQSIYRFQWANIENMLDFSSHYPKTQFIVLTDNYRSNQHILDASHTLIQNNKERLSNKIESIEKKLIASGNLQDDITPVHLFRASSDNEEQSYIISSIKEKIAGNYSIQEIAVIVRNNREVETWTKLLEQQGIQTESKLKTDILSSQYIDFILKYWSIILDPYKNEETLIDIMRSNITWLNQVDILRINRELYIKNYSRKFKLTMMDYLTDESYLDEVDITSKEALITFRDALLKYNWNISDNSITEFIHEFLNDSGILSYIETHADFDDIQDVFTLLNKVKDWNYSDKNLTIKKALDKIELYKSYNYPIPRQILSRPEAWVQIMTAHGSKWLEFNSVYIPGLYTGNWEGKRMIDKLKLPSWITWDGLQETNFKQIEEDRRLFFVALTRAKQELYLSFPAGIWNKPLLQSSFIEEIKDNYKEIHPDDISEINKEIITEKLKTPLISFWGNEFQYIEEFLLNYKLSASDLNVFLEDPIQFLNRAVFKYPFKDNQFTIFWKVYHRTLELFYLKQKQEAKTPEVSYLTSTFKLLLQKEVLTSDEYEKLLEKWINGLTGYYEQHINLNLEPLLLEYSFRRKNITFHWVPLTGTIDKVEKLWEASMQGKDQEWQLAFFKDSVRLVDYKTGKIKSIWQIKWIDRYGNKKEDPSEGKYFRQMMFYKLLTELDHEFSSKFEVESLTLDFVEWKNDEYKTIEVDYTPEEYEEFKKQVLKAWSQISDINFWKDLLWLKITLRYHYR